MIRLQERLNIKVSYKPRGVGGVDPISLPLRRLLIVITPSRRYINFFNAQVSQRANNVTGQLQMRMSPVIL